MQLIGTLISMAINVDKTLIKPSFVQKLRSKTDLESD